MASILVVDDRADARDLLASVLGPAGHNVVQAAGGESALASARADHPELIVTDILMRGMDGYELVHRLRADASLRNTRVVFYTATYLLDEVRRLAAQCGVEHFLIKPCEPATIIDVVDAALSAGPVTFDDVADSAFDRTHVEVLNEKLLARTSELEVANLRAERLNEELRDSEQQFRLLFDRNPLPMMLFERESLQIVSVNAAMVGSYGYSRGELLSMTVSELHPAEDVEALLEFMSAHPGGSRPEVLGGASGRCWRHVYADGTVIDVEITGANLTTQGVPCRLVLCQNVTERRQALSELASAHAEAVEESGLKSAFLANISHEIRTPMNGVIGMTELLLGTALDAEQRAYAQQIAASSDQLMGLIENVLDISRLGAGQLELDCIDFDVYETVEQACAIADMHAQAKGIALELEVAEDTPRLLHGDPRRLRQILLNLASNAVKFTDAGRVGIRLSATAPQSGRATIHCEVEDTGIGVDPAVLERMFEPFAQADESTTRVHGGTGLGLAIAANLVALMGGTIGAESEPGRGSRFWFEVELPAPMIADPQLANGRL